MALSCAWHACCCRFHSVVPLVRGGLTDEQVGIFLNRLSDYLFMAARYAVGDRILLVE